MILNKLLFVNHAFAYCLAMTNLFSDSIVYRNSNNYNSNIINDASWKNEELAKEEEAFLAKPKLSRTPP